MKLYDGGRAPNPRRVKVFLAEKGITVATEPIDLGKLAHKSPEYTAINPLQRVPALELDDGTIISESIAIRRCSARGPRKRRWSRCGNGGLNSICSDRSRIFSATRIPP